jgi:DNA repair protein RadC
MPGKNKSAIKYWPEDERPRERLIKYGSSALSDAHLLGILIGSGDWRSKKNAVDLSLDLLNVFGTLENLDQATVTEICQVKGIGAAKAVQIKAALEVGKRMASKPTRTKLKLKSSQAFVEQFSPFLKHLKKEIVKIVLLDPKLQLIKDLTISEGSLNASIVPPPVRKTLKSPTGSTKPEKLSGFIWSTTLSLAVMNFLVLLMKTCCRMGLDIF